MVQDNSIEDLECPEQRNVCASPDDPGLIRPIRDSKRQADKVFVKVNAIETRSSNCHGADKC